jgi:hypothetical protein
MITTEMIFNVNLQTLLLPQFALELIIPPRRAMTVATVAAWPIKPSVPVEHSMPVGIKGLDFSLELRIV